MGPISIGVGLSGPLYSLYFPVPLNGKVAEGWLHRGIRKSVLREKEEIGSKSFIKTFQLYCFLLQKKSNISSHNRIAKCWLRFLDAFI